MTRNLICHIYPRKCGKWRRTVEHLCSAGRWEQFDGLRLIAVAIDETCDDAREVRQAFGPRGAQFMVVDNNPELQEVATFVAHLQQLSREPGITFRCHAKGATHADGGNPASHVWADAMFSTCLDSPELIDCVMSKKEICGPFSSFGIWGGPGYHSWHFAGSFYWFRNEAAFCRDWGNVRQAFWGVEAWPGIFTVEESACLFCDRANTHQLYDVDWWKIGIAPGFAHWCQNVRLCGVGFEPYLPHDSLIRRWAQGRGADPILRNVVADDLSSLVGVKDSLDR